MSAKKQKKKRNNDKIVTNPEPIENEEKEETKDEIDCCDRCLFASFGYILIYIGIFVIFFTERDHKYSQRDISYIGSNLQLLDIETQKPGDINTMIEEVIENKYPIHFIDEIAGKFEKNMIVIDDLTDLSYPGIALKIHSEMFQWIEKEEVLRKEGTTQTESKYNYTKEWSSTFHDSSNFNKQDGHYNPQPTVSKLSTRNVWVDDIIIGKNKHVQFHLAKSLYTKLSKRELWKNVTQSAAEYSSMDTWEMRDGYLFRPYDKAESWYAETETPQSNDDEQQEEEEEDEEEEQEEKEHDMVKESEKKEERVRLDKPRTMIGDIRMTVFSLDSRGETISYLGGLKLVEDYNQNVLIPWKSPTNHKFTMLKYGKYSHNDALEEFSTENVLKLWLTRLFTFVFMFIGFMILQNVLQTTILQLKLPLKPIPFETWLQTIIGALTLSGIIWIITILIAYIIGIIHLALTLIVGIVVGLFLNNKTLPINDEQELKTKKDK